MTLMFQSIFTFAKIPMQALQNTVDWLGGLAGHAAFTATTGAGLGYARETSSRFLQVASPTLGWLLAILQHVSWTLLGGVLVSFIGVALLTPLVARPVVSVLGRLFSWSVPGKLGRLNSGRNPRRNR